MKFVYVNFTDMSVTKGNSINERGFVRALLSQTENEVIYVGPSSGQSVEFLKNSMHRVIEIPIAKGFVAEFLYQIKLYFTLSKIVRKSREDVVLCCRPHYFSLATIIVKYIYSTPLISKEAGLGVELYKKHRSGGVLVRCLSSFVRTLHGKKADVLWCVTGRIRDYWVLNHSVDTEKAVVIPNGADVTMFRPDVPAELPQGLVIDRRWEWALLYAGHLNSHVAGLDSLLDAISVLVGEGIDLGLIVAGDGEQRVALEKKVIEIGLEGRVVFAGWLPYSTMPGLFAYCDILTALLGRQFLAKHGSSSQKVLQSIAIGRPLIAGRTEDHEFIPKYGFGQMVDPEASEEIATAIRDCIDIGKQPIETTGFNYVQDNYSYDSIARAVLGVAGKLLHMKTG